MSRFQDVSDRIYVGYSQGDLSTYSGAANTDAQCYGGNVALYDAIDTEFNPDKVPTFKAGQKITPTHAFDGPNGLSLKLTDHGNLYLYDNIQGNTVWSGCTNINQNFKLNEINGTQFTCSNGNIIDPTFSADNKRGNIIVNPYCALDIFGNIVCFGCTIASGTRIPYMTYYNPNPLQTYSGLNLIIDGSYSLPVNSFGGTGTNKNMRGNLTIIAGNNYIVNSTIENADYQLLKGNLQTTFDNAKECNNATAATNLSNDYNKHLAAEQLKTDTSLSYNIHYMNSINLGVGIVATLVYIYYLRR
jgi:hypothetical protein